MQNLYIIVYNLCPWLESLNLFYNLFFKDVYHEKLKLELEVNFKKKVYLANPNKKHQC